MIGKDEIARLIEAAEIDSGQFARAGTALAEQREHIAALEAKRKALLSLVRRLRAHIDTFNYQRDRYSCCNVFYDQNHKEDCPLTLLDAALRGEGRE